MVVMASRNVWFETCNLDKATMALQSWLITDPNEVLIIINNMSDRCSGEDNSANDNDI